MVEVNKDDLKVIRGLERELGCEIPRRETLKRNQTGYQVNDVGRVAGVSLFTLNISGCNISILQQLSSLNTLFLVSNLLTTLPEWFKELKQLTELDLSFNKLTTLPEDLKELKQLTALDLSNNRLTTLPEWFKELKQLTWLHLSFNQLTTLPSWFIELKQLTMLFLSFNKLTTLPGWFIELKQLTALGLRSNELTTLPEWFIELKQLTWLDLGFNKLTTLPSWFIELKQLTWLGLGSNQLTTLPEGFKELKQLTELDLDSNQLTTLPEGFKELKNLKHLYLHNNARLKLPPEILGPTSMEVISDNTTAAKPSDILDYYFRILKSKTRPLNEAKVILVGQGSVGKTSVVRRWLDNIFDEHEDKTKGIKIRRENIKVGSDSIRLNIWDFGGQEIMHSTHQFFLTKRSLYLLILDSRISEAENRLEYWLKMIRSYGEESPVILVGNKSDQHPLDIDGPGLMKKYPAIKKKLTISCKTGDGIEELRQAIVQEIDHLEHVRDILTEDDFKVKNELEAMTQKDSIDYQQYVQLCINCGITEESHQRQLVQLLHNLGIVLNFNEDPHIGHTHVLNPKWVTEGVYAILNSNQLFQSRGVLALSMLTEILDTTRYKVSDHSFIVDMMDKFELCFPMETRNIFLVPDLLPKEELFTGNNEDWNESLRFEYHYDVLPSSIISRFVVRMHSHIHKKTYWRTGVLLKKDGCEARIRADLEEGKIRIEIKGPHTCQRGFLTAIRTVFEEIHSTIKGIKANGKVPLPDNPDIVVDYIHLLTLEQNHKDTCWPERVSREYRVKDLLNGIEPEEERLKKQEGKTIYNVDNRGGSATFGKGSPIENPTNTQATQKEKDRLKKPHQTFAIIAALIAILGFFGVKNWSTLKDTISSVLHKSNVQSDNNSAIADPNNNVANNPSGTKTP